MAGKCAQRPLELVIGTTVLTRRTRVVEVDGINSGYTVRQHCCRSLHLDDQTDL